MLIAVDTGHGFVKAVQPIHQRVMFPSLIAPLPSGPDLGQFRSKKDIVTLNGTPYLVGSAARLSATSLFSRDKATDPLTIALTTIAAAELAGPGYHREILGVGVPLTWYAAQKEAVANALVGRSMIESEGSLKCELIIEQVQVFPQGIGALVAIKNLPHHGLVGLIDIGYRTIDYVLSELRDGLPVPLAQYAGTYAGGMHLAYQAMSQAIEKDTGVRFEAHELVEREVVTARGHRIPVEPYRSTAFQSLAQDVSRHLAAAWDGVGDKLDNLYMAGGGAVALSEHLNGLGFPVLLCPDSQWANAEGYLILLDP